MNPDSELSITIIAGEASGDLYGSLLARSILKQSPNAYLQGIGGEAMSKAGVTLLHSISDLSVMGFVEVVRHIPKLLSLKNRMVKSILSANTAAVVLVDFPDFNLRVAKKIFDHKIHNQLGFPKIYYFVPPQVWIWRKKRIYKIKQLCDAVFPLFLFEHEMYTAKGIKSFYAGHPITNLIPRDQYDQKGNENQAGILSVGLFPGSRIQEIKKILPVMLRAVSTLAKSLNPDFKTLTVLISRCEWIDEVIYTHIIEKIKVPMGTSIKLETQSRAIMHRTDVILCKSGTINLEIALFKKPLIIAYKTSWLTWIIAKLWLRISHISLINLLSGKSVVREFVQYNAKPVVIAEEMRRILTDTEYRKNMVKELDEFTARQLPSNPHSVTDDIAQYLLKDIK